MVVCLRNLVGIGYFNALHVAIIMAKKLKEKMEVNLIKILTYNNPPL
jgi:hypothetical protein